MLDELRKAIAVLQALGEQAIVAVAASLDVVPLQLFPEE
jgi:hypothetical protein